MNVHHGLGIQRLYVKVIWKAMSHSAHGGSVCAEDRSGSLWIERLRVWIALRQSGDERLFNRRCGTGQTLSTLRRLQCNLCSRFRQHQHVVVWAHCQRDTPGADCAGGIEFKCMRKGSCRFIVIERPEKPHALVEIALGLWRAGAYLAVIRPEAVVKSGAFGPTSERSGHGYPHVHCARLTVSLSCMVRRGCTMCCNRQQCQRARDHDLLEASH